MLDPEIKAMSAVAEALAELEEAVQGRVLRWAVERYGASVPLSGQRGAARGEGPAADVDDGETDIPEEQIVDEAPAYEHLAELFADAQPRTEVDKALVAAYWIQAIQGQPSWQASVLQRELKNMGQPINNITDALTKNMRKKPPRVIQLQKSGSARQARKTYKLTREGLVYVQGMLRGA
jgi:hypothetical protein